MKNELLRTTAIKGDDATPPPKPSRISCSAARPRKIGAPVTFSLEGRMAISVDEFCALFDFGRNKFYAEVRAGRIQILKAGKSTLIDAQEPRRYLARLQSGGVDAAA